MAKKVRIGKWEVDEAELDREIEEATRRGEERMKTEPRAASARYDARAKRIVVELTNDCVFMFPTELAQGLRGASPADLAEVEVMGPGFALGWDKLDTHFSLAGLMSGLFGNKAWMAGLRRKSGRVKSGAKAGAARGNARKGGRPRETKRA